MELGNAMDVPTLEQWLADDLPHALVSYPDEDEARRVSEACYGEHLDGLRAARELLDTLSLSRNQLDQLATMILKEDI
jgi:hypothetical protein